MDTPATETYGVLAAIAAGIGAAWGIIKLWFHGVEKALAAEVEAREELEKSEALERRALEDRVERSREREANARIELMRVLSDQGQRISALEASQIASSASLKRIEDAVQAWGGRLDNLAGAVARLAGAIGK